MSRPTLLEHGAICIEQGVQLAGIVPAFHVDHFQRGAFVDHVLKSIGEKILAELRRLPHYVIDSLEQQLPVPDVVQSDVRPLGDGVLRLLDDPRHVPAGICDDYAEALIVFDLLGPNDAVGVGRIDDGKIGVEDGVHEDD